MSRKTKKMEKTVEQSSVTEVPQATGEAIASNKQSSVQVVGIGASAGGLEAIEQFFSNLPSDSGMAYVIVQHLDPMGKSSMPEILTRFTRMSIQVASDGLKVEPNSVYLIPPNKYLGIQNGKLNLQEPGPPRGLRLPIDFFFRSLSKEKGPEAIGIILSGTGTDGTLGIRAIKAELGTVFVQDPESARYDGMPRSAIETGLADFIVKPNDMPQKLIHFVKQSVLNIDRTLSTSIEEQEPYQQIFAFLRARTGHDFSHYKQTTIHRRLQRRMSVYDIDKLADYAIFLRENEDEVKALLKDLLISVTNFFRDPDAFESLQDKLKKVIELKDQDSDFRVWVAGCATGEEAYSIAIIISECMQKLHKQLQVQIYGTDIDMNALRVARAGVYPAKIEADISTERLKRYFVKNDDSYHIKKEIRGMMVFAPQNFIKDPPFSKLDLICCRNLMIYLESDIQKRLIPLLHYALKPGGLLFLGTSETIGEATDLFEVVDKREKIYKRRETFVATDRLKFPSAFTPSLRYATSELSPGIQEPRISELTEKIFMDNYAPTFAVIDEKYRLVYVRGRTGKYLEIASGQPSLSVLEMARQGLRLELASAIYRANSIKKPITVNGLQVKTNGDYQTINLIVAPLNEGRLPSGLTMLVFQEVGEPFEEIKSKRVPVGHKKVAGLEEELKFTKENLQNTIEELEAANEELKSANEELQSNNEELQSTNEELDTSREEMQSLNEELTTVNAELRDKNDQLIKANDDLRNFLDRTDIAIIFLDEELNIRSFTPATTDVFNIRERDIGRSLSEITTRLAYDGVVADARDVLRTQQSKESEIQRTDGCWYKMRILPYRTIQNTVEGLVISFMDINEQKKAVGSLRETRDYLENLINYANAPIVVWDPDLKITRFNHAFEQLTGFIAEQIIGKKINIIFPPEKLDDNLKQINRISVDDSRWEVVEIPVSCKDGGTCIVLWNSATIYAQDGITPIATIAQGQDITERKKSEEELQRYAAELENANKELESFSYSVSHDLRAPLRALDGFSEAIEMDYQDRLDEKGKDYLHRIRQASNTMAQLTDDLLKLSRLSRLKMEIEIINLSELVESAADQLKASQPERHVEFKIQPDVKANGDRQLLKVLIRNLLDNSWKFTSHNYQARIEFGVKDKDGKPVYFVKDNGAGFNMKYADKLFQPFQRLHSTQEFPGNGIGLATVARIVRRHGGIIWAESEKGKGATFYFTLGSLDR